MHVGCPGGGYLQFDKIQKTIRIFGTSYGYGKADHNVTKQLILGQEEYKGYKVAVDENYQYQEKYDWPWPKAEFSDPEDVHPEFFEEIPEV